MVKNAGPIAFCVQVLHDESFWLSCGALVILAAGSPRHAFRKGARHHLERFWSTLTFLCFGFGSGTASHLEKTSIAPYGWLFVPHSCFELAERCLPCLWLCATCPASPTFIDLKVHLPVTHSACITLKPASRSSMAFGFGWLCRIRKQTRSATMNQNQH